MKQSIDNTDDNLNDDAQCTFCNQICSENSEGEKCYPWNHEECDVASEQKIHVQLLFKWVVLLFKWVPKITYHWVIFCTIF